MSEELAFTPGSLERQIALRGLSQREFAALADLDETTILKAIRGKRVRPKSWGKILIALGAVPAPDVPADMVEQSA